MVKVTGADVIVVEPIVVLAFTCTTPALVPELNVVKTLPDASVVAVVGETYSPPPGPPFTENVTVAV
jgi:hypothetical protein